MEALERDLIESAQQGNAAAFEQLISPLEKQMLSTAASLASSPDDGEDIYQDAMINAFKALPGFRMESRFNTWLYRILLNTAMGNRRKLKNRLSRFIFNDKTQTEENASQSAFESYGHENNPEAVLLNAQLSSAINRALASLSDKERIAFVLCHQQELKMKEAARVMECSDGTVKSYLFRAREKMRTQLKAFTTR